MSSVAPSPLSPPSRLFLPLFSDADESSVGSLLKPSDEDANVSVLEPSCCDSEASVSSSVLHPLSFHRVPNDGEVETDGDRQETDRSLMCSAARQDLVGFTYSESVEEKKFKHRRWM